MAHIYAAGGSRRSAVFTAIIGLHIALFLLVINDELPAVAERAREPSVIEVFPPPPPRDDVVPPDAPGKVDFGDVVVSDPQVKVPDFETADSVLTARTDGVESISQAKSVVRIPATLKGRSADFAKVIRACYAAAARRRGEEGSLKIAVVIGNQGQVRSWRVAQGSGFPLLDAAAPCVLGRLGFNAAREDGRGIESEVLLPIVFRLD